LFFQCLASWGKKKKKQWKTNLLSMRNIVVIKPLFLMFKPIYFPCYSSQGSVSFLYRGIWQGGSNSILFYLILVCGVMTYLVFYYRTRLSLTRLLATTATRIATWKVTGWIPSTRNFYTFINLKSKQNLY
jgi:hypothetical protein